MEAQEKPKGITPPKPADQASDRSLLRRLLREPLVHFLGLALAVFALYALIAEPGEDGRDPIVVSSGRIAQLESLFAQARMRPPTPEELKALIDDYVASELYRREAMRLGMEKDDPVVQRRLRQKMELMIAAEVEAEAPTDADLQGYLAAHPELFRTEPRYAFDQVYLSTDSRGESIAAEAEVTLAALRADPDADPQAFGDPTLLPQSLPLTSVSGIDRIFGPGFGISLSGAVPGTWFGPVSSGFGQHLVRVLETEPLGVPPLDQIRDVVAREWTNDRVQAALKANLERLLEETPVQIDLPVPAPP